MEQTVRRSLVVNQANYDVGTTRSFALSPARYCRLFADSLFIVGIGLICLLITGAAVQASFDEAISALDKGDSYNGLRLLEDAAKAGDPRASFKLGWLYYHGQFVQADAAKAREWYGKGANLGHTSSQRELGKIILDGIGVPASPKQAADWFWKCAGQGDGECFYLLGRLHQYGDGVTMNLPKAIELYMTGAKLGSSDCENQIGNLYMHGIGLKQNVEAALDWYQKAVAKGNGRAEYNLAVAYENGTGVPVNYEEAARLYHLSAGRGFYWPKYRLGRLYELGRGVPKSYEEAAYWYSIATNFGYDKAQLSLARLFEDGNGVRQNFRIAEELYGRAAKSNHPEAKARLSVLQQKMKERERSLAVSPEVMERVRDLEEQKDTTNLAATVQTHGETLPPIGDILVNHGKALVGAGYPDISVKSGSRNDRFFQQMVQAIQFVEKFPRGLRRYADMIREVIYNPPSEHRKRKDIYTNYVAVYTISRDFNQPAPMVVYSSMIFTNPRQLAMGLVINGVYADRHQQMIKLRKRINEMQKDPNLVGTDEFSQLMNKSIEMNASLYKTDLNIVEKYKCKIKQITQSMRKLFGELYDRELLHTACFDSDSDLPR